MSGFRHVVWTFAAKRSLGGTAHDDHQEIIPLNGKVVGDEFEEVRTIILATVSGELSKVRENTSKLHTQLSDKVNGLTIQWTGFQEKVLNAFDVLTKEVSQLLRDHKEGIKRELIRIENTRDVRILHLGYNNLDSRVTTLETKLAELKKGMLVRHTSNKMPLLYLPCLSQVCP